MTTSRRLLRNLGLLSLLALSLGLTRLAHAGGTAPDFSLKDVDGRSVALADHLGQDVIVISFWATWCTPCKAEMPHLETMYKELKEHGFVVLSISVDEARNEPLVKSTVKAGGYTFPVLLDQSTEVVTLFNPRKSIPYTVVIGKDKKIHKSHEGYAPGDEATLRAEVEALLGIGDAPDTSPEGTPEPAADPAPEAAPEATPEPTPESDEETTPTAGG